MKKLYSNMIINNAELELSSIIKWITSNGDSANDIVKVIMGEFVIESIYFKPTNVKLTSGIIYRYVDGDYKYLQMILESGNITYR